MPSRAIEFFTAHQNTIESTLLNFATTSTAKNVPGFLNALLSNTALSYEEKLIDLHAAINYYPKISKQLAREFKIITSIDDSPIIRHKFPAKKASKLFPKLLSEFARIKQGELRENLGAHYDDTTLDILLNTKPLGRYLLSDARAWYKKLLSNRQWRALTIASLGASYLIATVLLPFRLIYAVSFWHKKRVAWKAQINEKLKIFNQGGRRRNILPQFEKQEINLSDYARISQIPELQLILEKSPVRQYHLGGIDATLDTFLEHCDAVIQKDPGMGLWHLKTVLDEERYPEVLFLQYTDKITEEEDPKAEFRKYLLYLREHIAKDGKEARKKLFAKSCVFNTAFDQHVKFLFSGALEANIKSHVDNLLGQFTQAEMQAKHDLRSKVLAKRKGDSQWRSKKDELSPTLLDIVSRYIILIAKRLDVMRQPVPQIIAEIEMFTQSRNKRNTNNDIMLTRISHYVCDVINSDCQLFSQWSDFEKRHYISNANAMSVVTRNPVATGASALIAGVLCGDLLQLSIEHYSPLPVLLRKCQRLQEFSEMHIRSIVSNIHHQSNEAFMQFCIKFHNTYKEKFLQVYIVREKLESQCNDAQKSRLYRELLILSGKKDFIYALIQGYFHEKYMDLSIDEDMTLNDYLSDNTVRLNLARRYNIRFPVESDLFYIEFELKKYEENVSKLRLSHYDPQDFLDIIALRKKVYTASEWNGLPQILKQSRAPSGIISQFSMGSPVFSPPQAVIAGDSEEAVAAELQGPLA